MFVISYDVDEVLGVLDIYEKDRPEKIVVICNHRTQVSVLEFLYNYNKNITFINPDIYDYSKICGYRPQVMIVLNPHSIERDVLEQIYSGWAAVSSNPIEAVKENVRRKLVG